MAHRKMLWPNKMILTSNYDYGVFMEIPSPHMRTDSKKKERETEWCMDLLFLSSQHSTSWNPSKRTYTHNMTLNPVLEAQQELNTYMKTVLLNTFRCFDLGVAMFGLYSFITHIPYNQSLFDVKPINDKIVELWMVCIIGIKTKSGL